eukprot:comp17012_c0_seq1/m.27987 comp17012_c0_seq1/g.27987  ORF comp17012_c0_seq1/g.27987 comp17012_c0_seq1/m.27987 type:complete len:222 (-) comp17012_c0_seq1:258-923(-)
MRSISTVALVALAVLSCAHAIDLRMEPVVVIDEANTCPPAGFTSAQNFSIAAYTAHTWYVQLQTVVTYLPKKDFFCCEAHYNQTGPTSVGVLNSCRTGSVNGPNDGAPICAKVKNPQIPSQLSVGFCWEPEILYGPYWVIAVGLNPDGFNYDWAIVSGGPPKKPSNGACITGTGVDGSGLWIFTRSRIADPALVNQIVALAQKKGFDTSTLLPVVQEGCTN